VGAPWGAAGFECGEYQNRRSDSLREQIFSEIDEKHECKLTPLQSPVAPRQKTGQLLATPLDEIWHEWV